MELRRHTNSSSGVAHLSEHFSHWQSKLSSATTFCWTDEAVVVVFSGLELAAVDDWAGAGCCCCCCCCWSWLDILGIGWLISTNDQRINRMFASKANSVWNSLIRKLWVYSTPLFINRYPTCWYLIDKGPKLWRKENDVDRSFGSRLIYLHTRVSVSQEQSLQANRVLGVFL